MPEPPLDEAEIFNAARRLEDPEVRRAYLDRACGTDAALRDRVEALLGAHESRRSFLEPPSPSTEKYRPDSLPDRETAGMAIGPYKLVERIGEGGMGEVWMAQQTEPVKRLVALKLIKPGMDSRAVLARFEAERQALALMDHPNIAKVLDAGATADGRPYFLMELVKGVPITRYCDERRLTPHQRLALFIPVCQAIQHAHQKGVIHRDIKPSNVLVAMYDGRPVPKVIDFGVAKATGQQLTDMTLNTGFGAVVGTPEYMSPEQASFNQLDVDTRSDIYSLGVLLYELLAGSPPFSRKELDRAGILEILRVIREEEPSRPSTKLSTADGLPTLAANRGTEPKRLMKQVRGELDWIVMKALDKDRCRRYETANSFALDVQRYLNDEAVLACPPSVGYRLRKFARRNRRAVAMATLLVVLLVMGVIGLSIANVQIRQAKQKVDQALEQERRESYRRLVGLANGELAANNLQGAEELLELCPADLRGWEWRYLKRQRGKVLPPLRHGSAVFACVIHPLGREMASADLGGFITFWDIASGQMLRRFRGHEEVGTGWVYLAYSPDGLSLASADPKGHLKIWDVNTGQQLRAWHVPDHYIETIAFSPDGRRLARSISNYGLTWKATLSIHDALTGAELLKLGEFDQSSISQIIFTPDGTRIAAACTDGTATIYDSNSGAVLRTFRGNCAFKCAALSADGRLLAAGSGDEAEQTGIGVVVWDIDSGREVLQLRGHGALALAFSPDGSRLAGGGIDQVVRLWDTATGHQLLTLHGHLDFVRAVAFTPDGHRLMSASEDRTVRIWDARPWQDGEKRGEEVFTLDGHTDSVNAVAYHPMGGRLATAASDGLVKIWDTASGRELLSRSVGLKRVLALAFTRDGTQLFVSGNPGPSVIVLDPTTGDELRRLGDHTDAIMSIALSPDDKRLATGSTDGVVVVWDVATGAAVHRLAHRWVTYSMSFSPDPEGRLLAVSDSNEGCVRVWDMKTGQEVNGSPLRHQGVVQGVAFSPDGQLLASAGWDRKVRIWDVKTWKPVDVLHNPTSSATDIAFSPDSRLLAWGRADSAIAIWHRGTGEIDTLRGHLDWVRHLAFSPDGRRIASASKDGTAKIWEAPVPRVAPAADPGAAK